ncbi:hypothetical protein Ade02nite_20910 [Paractinoplanes deccanensis]|uniref:Uncharacterized protein n=1 Tax=Paractinoplanes deccanensis TaxID=113561 RepID=A0ABQ3Y0E9_9ACTN|nr:hypothetical protein [Actinoplanes deccanensis]GID73450.1 hypothetical protein Ade02nite_20910 [Actinoplanes deccanensis]
MIKQLSQIEDEIAYQVGSVIIKLKWVNHDAYAVTVYNGTDRIEDNCGSYPTEAEARLIARGYAEMYKAEHDAKPTSLADYRQTSRVQPTRSRVHTKPLTAAELARVRAHRNGVVTLLPGQPWTMLRAIVRRGYADQPDGHRPGQKYTQIRLNARGLAAIENEEVAA